MLKELGNKFWRVFSQKEIKPAKNNIAALEAMVSATRSIISPIDRNSSFICFEAGMIDLELNELETEEKTTA